MAKQNLYQTAQRLKLVSIIVAGLIAPKSLALVGFLMFGNLLSECGVLSSLADTAKNNLANLITLLACVNVKQRIVQANIAR